MTLVDGSAAPGAGGGGTVGSDGSTSLAIVIRGLKKHDGIKPEEFSAEAVRYCRFRRAHQLPRRA